MSKSLEKYLKTGEPRTDKTDNTPISSSRSEVLSVLSVPDSPISQNFFDLDGLPEWLERVGKVRTDSELMALLSAFRARGWTDVERAQMSRAYMRQVSRL